MKSDPSVQLKVMVKRLEDMFQLLNLWQQYIDIIYMPEHEIGQIKIMREVQGMDGDADDLTFASKMKSENIETKLKTLFAKDEEALEDETEKIKQDLEDPYLTVNEGMTTDTAVTTDVE